MSFKTDSLLKKATTYERLCVYGDRKVYLAALAQAINLPDTTKLVAAVKNATNNLVAVVTQFWQQNPQAVPIPAREAYSALRYPQTDITSATVPELTSALDQISAASDSMFRSLTNSGNEQAVSFASRTLFPAMENLKQQISNLKEGLSGASTTPEEGTVMQMPTDHITGHRSGQPVPPVPDYIQQSLNDLLGTKLIVDGKLGPLTRAALDRFKKEYNMPNGATDQDAFKLIIDQAGKKYTGQLHPTTTAK